MADTDELFAHPTAVPGVVHTALVLNLKGVERAVAAGARHLSMSISASETHSLRNTNRTFEEAKRHIIPMIETALSNGIEVRAGLQKAYYGLTYGTTVPRDGDDTVPKYADIAKACGVEGVRAGPSSSRPSRRRSPRASRSSSTSRW
jgi:isopropylmalate/homocitrate/citramalate synthase